VYGTLVRCPCVQLHGTKVHFRAGRATLPNARMTKRTPLIAVVDDERSVRTALARVLRASGFDVALYGSAEEFLRSLEHEAPDCVIVDFQMPGLTGRDVQQALASSAHKLPLIMVTAHDHGALREEVLADGAAAYLTKPLHSDKLVDAIANSIRTAASHTTASQ
jgi:FixJ family two-component response regulator